MPEQALSGVKVVDLTWHIAGPYCTKLFADYGADVVKIERPDGGDPTRRMGPFYENDPSTEKSLLFLHLNTNKRSITLNLKTATGKKILKELVKDAHLLVENFSPHVMPSLGLDYDTMAKINPNLVMTSISNFGQTGPYRDYLASEIIINGMGGKMLDMGLPEREPQRGAANTYQYQAGNTASTATMMGLYVAETQGIGQHIDVSIFELLNTTMDHRTTNLVAYQYNGQIQAVRESVVGLLPNGILRCQDGFVLSFVFPGMASWRNLGPMLGIPDLLEQFPDPFDVERRGELEALWVPFFFEHGKQELMEKAQAAGVSITAINTPKDVMEDAHFNAREFFVDVEHPITGKFKYPGAPYRTEEMPWKIRIPAPLLGQHNEDVYGALGYSKKDLVWLWEAGIV